MKQEYSFNDFKYMRIMMSELQRRMETELTALSQKYALKKPLLFSHNWILQCLYYAKQPLSLTEVTKQAGLSLPNVSVGMGTLIELGIVQQVALNQNKRVRYVELTEFGRQLCDEYVEKHLPEICEGMYRGVTQEQFDAVRQYYLQVAQNIGCDTD